MSMYLKDEEDLGFRPISLKYSGPRQPPPPPPLPQPLKPALVVLPRRDNMIGVIYENDGQLYIAEPIQNAATKEASELRDESNDHLIKSIEDIKKLYTIKQLKGPVA